MSQQITPSQQQLDIFNAYHQTLDNLAVIARAGSGKTTTAIELSRTIPVNVSQLYCAFNRSIVDYIQPKLEGLPMVAKSFHSLGYTMLRNHIAKETGDTNARDWRNWTINDNKLQKICFNAVKNSHDVNKAIDISTYHIKETKARSDQAYLYFVDTVSMLKNTVNMMMLHLVDRNNRTAAMAICYRKRFDKTYKDQINDAAFELIPGIFAESERQTVEEYSIGYIDQIYWPAAWKAYAYKRYQVVILDEAQDLSPAQREIVNRHIAYPDGRIIVIGDDKQAIYEFAGADPDSFDRSVRRWRCKTYPLTTTYRCSKQIVALAQQIVPDIQALPNAPDGTVEYVNESAMLSNVQIGDMILCRLKAPLVEACLEFLINELPATILGRSIGESLIEIVDRTEKLPEFNIQQLDDYINLYEAQEVEKMLAHDDEMGAEGLKDRVRAVRAIIHRVRVNQAVKAQTLLSVGPIRDFINDLFTSEHAKDQITLATVHSAKGRESERVWIIAPEYLPLNHEKMTDVQREQELNLFYVAVTRAKTFLGFLTNTTFTDPDSLLQPDTLFGKYQQALPLPKPSYIDIEPHYELPTEDSPLLLTNGQTDQTVDTPQHNHNDYMSPDDERALSVIREFLKTDRATCPNCDGNGFDNTPDMKCEPCNGTGKVIKESEDV